MSKLADWLARHGETALQRGDLRPEQRRALLAIRRCRTPAAGGHRYRCTHCGGEHHGYHSCHHRACPRCGGEKTAAWTQKQVERLLPVPYFFVTCTVPASLHGAFAARPEVLHRIFFAVSAAALQGVAAQPRHLGAELGMLAVLLPPAADRCSTTRISTPSSPAAACVPTTASGARPAGPTT